MIAEDSEERVPLNRAEAGVAPARSRRNTKIIERYALLKNTNAI